MKTKVILTIFTVSLLGSPCAWTAPKAQKMAEKKISPASITQQPAKKEKSKAEDVEVLFNTLNDTLEENRKIHLSLKEMQTVLQKTTLENSDLRTEMHKLETLALERNHELLTKSSGLEEQIKNSETAMTTFESEKKSFNEEKEKIEKRYVEIQEENEKLRKILSSSVLEEEKEVILKTAKENEKAASQAEGLLSRLNMENQKMKNDSSAAQYEVGNIYFKLKQYKEAVEAYKKALDYDPANSWAYHNMAVIEDYYLNDTASACLHYQMYLNYKPLAEEAQEVRARLLDLNLLRKIAPTTPLKNDFDKMHQESNNAKI